MSDEITPSPALDQGRPHQEENSDNHSPPSDVNYSADSVDEGADDAGAPDDPLAAIDEEIEAAIEELSDSRKMPVYLLDVKEMTTSTVDDVFDSLGKKFSPGNEKLEILLQSDGGDIHSAYNLALLIRRYATKALHFIVARWAKSAATLLCCGGDKIFMTPVAELGPVDPQITQFNPLEGRLEQFSPLDMEATLELIRNEFTTGQEKLARGLLERLQFPLTLGGFKKSLRVSREYIHRLLKTGMFRADSEREAKTRAMGERLVEGYSDHGFCIDIHELKSIGFVAEELAGDDLCSVWKVYKLGRQRNKLQEEARKKEAANMLKSIPPSLLNDVDPEGNPQHSAARPMNASFMNNLMTKPQGIAKKTDDDLIVAASRLAVALLRLNGEISVNHIKGIPNIDTDGKVNAVLDRLVNEFGAEIFQKKVTSVPVLRWERFVRLKAR